MQSIYWSRHAKQRFAEKAVRYGVNYGDLELAIAKQKVKLKEPGRDKFKTVFKLLENFFTVVKVETGKFIHVLTLWESNETEVQTWREKMK